MKGRVARRPSRRYKIEDFEMGDIIGEGSYSIVKKAYLKDNNRMFACKVIPKILLIRKNKVKMATTEKRILATLRHPFMIRLGCTFQDEENLYFMMEFASKGEIFQYLTKYKRFSMKTTQFYIAELISVIEFFHKNGVVHLDLKPENVMIQSNGHIRLVDFGTCVFLGEQEDKITCVGTPEYMSPELVKSSSTKNVTTACDLWSIGCMIFKFLTGKYPFGINAPFIIFKNALSCKYEIPDYLPVVAKDVIKRLLVRDPKQRLTIDELKKHEFFKGIEFEKLHEMKPPSFDPSTFEDYVIIEEEENEDNGTRRINECDSDMEEKLAKEFGDIIEKE